MPNRTSREVKSGHYVLVEPMPLPDPYIVAYSPEMAGELGLSLEECQTDAFARLFSGDLPGGLPSWATPYALSIYGHEMYDNCPFGSGNGYGDGRALSIGEFVTGTGDRWELQLKGAGRTPFCRGGDGRAVLRSSIREFLASEAMHHLGVQTTRALSLVASRSEFTLRPWYSDGEKSVTEADLDKLARRLLKEQRGIDFDATPEEFKEQVRMQLRMQLKQSQSGRNPDIMQEEACAITCRAARSFLRVGHVDLFSRRARQGQGHGELELIVEHALTREYPDVEPGKPLSVRAVAMLRVAGQRFATLAADWLRVGYVQGNFNSDNCLVGGRTMDYGPFGFIEQYEPLWNMWVGGAEKYGFFNQPNAAFKNFETLAMAVMPLLDQTQAAEVQQIIQEYGTFATEALTDVWRRKLGLATWRDEGEGLFGKVEALLRSSRADWTIFWRSLADVAEIGKTDMEAEELLLPLRMSFYEALSIREEDAWVGWLREWLAALCKEGRAGAVIAAQMRQASPKYVPREWMLVAAYKAACRGDHAPLLELQKLFRAPYAEQPEFEERFYRRTPGEVAAKGGTAWMS